MRARVILGTAMLFAASSAQGSKVTLTGADFLSACTRPDPEWISFCHGYVQAIVDEERRPSEALCPPAGTTRAKIVDSVVAQLQAEPELQKLNAASVIHDLLLNAFPCR